MDDIVVDWDGNEINVGMLVLYGTPPKYGETDEEGLVYEDYVVQVVEITDADGDVDDEGRNIWICPYVVVKFRDGFVERVRSYRDTQVTWADYPDGPEIETYRVDDLEVLEK